MCADVLTRVPNRTPRGCGPCLPAAAGGGRSLRQQVFEHVRGVGRIARADIARALDVSAGSVTALTSDLIGRGILREVPEPRRGQGRELGRGRPPVSLEVVSDCKFVIGIKLGDTRHSAVLSDFAGNRLSEVGMTARDGRRGAAELLSECDTLVRRVLDRAGVALADVGCIGVGLPGIVDHDNGLVAWSPLLDVRNLAFRAMASAHFGRTVDVDNDANVLTLAELWFGAGRDMTDFAVVTIEQGVGMGLVLGNRLFRGSHGMGLELGHTKVQLDGALCRCGRLGCLEAYLADYALAREASTALGSVSAPDQTQQDQIAALFADAKAGNIAAQTVFRRAGRYLSVALANVVQLFDPDLIILSGDRMRHEFLYGEDVLSEMQQMALIDGRLPVRVEVHSWDDVVWAQGAAALALSTLTDQLLGDAWAA